MKRYCPKCERISEDGNRWCPETDCPAEAGPSLLDYGDWLGDVKVVQLLRVLRASAIYEAERNKTKLFLKVAHTREECVERLKREAKLLAALQPPKLPGLVKAFIAQRRPRLPVLVPPYQFSTSPYGEITFRGEQKCYMVFAHAPGVFLSDLLLENPQPWHQLAAWLVEEVIEALRPTIGRYVHLNFTPDMILVDTDKKGIYRPMLLDLGLALGQADSPRPPEYWRKFSSPAYTAPELLALKDATQTVSPAADVYALGIMLREMLVGKPAFASKLARDGEVAEAVRRYRGVLSVNRPELPREASSIVEKATSLATAERYADLNQFVNSLRRVFGAPPAEPQPRPIGQWIVLILCLILGVALAAILIIAVWQSLPQ